jgi:hypothetical protein
MMASYGYPFKNSVIFGNIFLVRKNIAILQKLDGVIDAMAAFIYMVL